jgi:hypothetical protein
MRQYLYFTCMMVLLAGCKGSANRNEQAFENEVTVNLTQKQVVEATRNYLMSTVKDPLMGENNGLYRIQGIGEVYIFDPAGVVIGKLDDDKYTDAFISCTYEHLGEPVTKRHFAVMGGDSLRVVASMVSNMNVITISDNMVFGQVSTLPADDPGGAPCEICVDTLRYRVVNDSIVEVD